MLFPLFLLLEIKLFGFEYAFLIQLAAYCVFVVACPDAQIGPA